MGYIYISLSALFFCLMTVFVKIAGQQLETIQIVFPKAESLLDITENADISTLSKKADELLESAFNKITS